MSETASAARGPRVFLDYDQAALDAAYNQRLYAPNAEQLLARFASASAAMRARLGEPLRRAYGPSETERLDIYQSRAGTAPAPIAVFVHGGAWRNGAARNYAFPAEMFTAAGAHYVALDFILVEAAGGSLMPMIEQVRRAIAWVGAHAADFGGDPRRLYLIGHSSGAHLSGAALLTDWTAFGLPDDLIRGALLVSGMYDLKPVRLSARSSYVKFDDAMEAALSTQRHIDRIRTPVTIAHGTHESPEFIRQSRDFAAALAAAGKPAELVLGENCNHFEMMDTLGNPYAVGGRAALAMMGLTLAGARRP